MQQVVHDGKIMRREIPNHIAIVLKKSQVHSCRIVVVELAERSLFEQLFYLADRTRKQECVVHHDLKILLLREVDQFFRLSHIAGEWFFHEHMLTILKRCLRQLVMRPHRSNHCNGIDVRRLYQLTTVTVDWQVRVCSLDALARCGTLIADPDDLAAIEGS